MIGKIIDMNFTDAFINFEDGTTMDIGISQLPADSKVGDRINLEPRAVRMRNDNHIDLF